MNLIEKASELGKLLEGSDEYQSFRNAEIVFLNDIEVQNKFNEYKKLFNEYKLTKNKELESSINDKYNVLLSNKVYNNYISAKNRYETLIDTINELVNYYVQYNSKSCSSNCGGCTKISKAKVE